MEDIVKNPGLQHIIKTTLTFLDKSDIACFRLVNQNCKNIVEDPIFSLKILSQLKDVPQPAVLQAEEKRARKPVPKCPSKLPEPAIG